jgi:pimeloyl-ACP methyl ester carboxylesterase
MSLDVDLIHEESLWFGTERPLFGRLTTPSGDLAKGGVLLSPPIGRESRLARRALRTLAMYLATDGYVSLRFDHFGTGDASGSMDDDELGRSWIDGVAHGTELLRSLGISQISAVGMRMGATIVGAAASARDIGLSSFVMWDPCESGRAYARELGALGALRRDPHAMGLGESTKMLEYPLSESVTRDLVEFTLVAPVSKRIAERVMVIVRDDRSVSKKFRAQWNLEHAEWATTSEQGPLLETELPDSVQPTSTIEQIRVWLTGDGSSPLRYSNPPPSHGAVVYERSNAAPVRERVVELGDRKMFGIVTEPTGDPHGPLLVMVNGINEDHVGPARLWVEFSRRWAALGLRCVRFDFSELGESSWLPGQPERAVFDWTSQYEIGDVVRALTPESPSESILVGLCSGAHVALKATLDLKARGLYAINPQMGAGVLRSADRLKNSDRMTVRSSAKRFERILKAHPWIDDVVQMVSRLVLLSAFSPNVRSAIAANNTEMLLVLGPNDFSPFARIPVVGSLLGQRLLSSEHIHVEVVPGLDHDFLSTLGRRRAIAILDQHVVDTLGPPEVLATR